MRKLQSQGVHHTTLVGAGRQTSIDFWEGVLGMPFVFEQPNEDRKPDPARTPTDPGCVHHIAFSVSQATLQQAVERLDERKISHNQ